MPTPVFGLLVLYSGRRMGILTGRRTIWSSNGHQIREKVAFTFASQYLHSMASLELERCSSLLIL